MPTPTTPHAQPPADMTFPTDFLWGAATSSYQIEGAADEDGRGPSIWDEFCHTPGAVVANHTGDVACDHYHRMPEDVGLMTEIGLQAYRFSIAWPRVLPDGNGKVCTAGLDFYERLVDKLLAADIQPWPTLYHWDLPLAMHQRGGWKYRDCAQWFAEYAGIVAERLGDRVAAWTTFNEPQVFIGFGYHRGTHAPGLKLPLPDVLQAAHHVLLAHGRAAQALRTATPDTPVGFVSVGVVALPGDDRPESLEAARASTLGVAPDDMFSNIFWLDPLCGRGYPEEAAQAYGKLAADIREGDLDVIAQPLDFIGINTYFGSLVVAGADGKAVDAPWPAGHPTTTMGWPVSPDSLYWGPCWIYDRYKVPLYITENGMANTEWPDPTGAVHDPQRVDFLRAYLTEIRRAIADGADIRGYFQWSLMDNFEWAEGYRQRFGLIYVDYLTGQRTLKDSAGWYKGVIASNGAALSR